MFGLLARCFLLFTLSLLAITGGLFLLWNAWLNHLYQPINWDDILQSEDLSQGNYESLARRLNGTNASFAVYDQDGFLLFGSQEDFDLVCSPEALAGIPVIEGTMEINAFETTDGFLLIRHTYDDSGNAQAVDIMALNKAYQVIFGGFGDGRTDYTPEEYQYLSGTRFPDSILCRSQVIANDGSALTVLIREGVVSESDYFRYYQTSQMIWLLFLPLFLLDTGLFIWWLSRKIGRPLRKLNDAVISQMEGRLSRVGDCGGPREIRQIGESFDLFSDRLAESEGERRRLDEGRQKLIADISHDLKTPITVIAGYANAICDGKVPPEEVERYLRAIQNKAAALTELVNAFHEYSKVEHPKFVLHMERTDLGEFSREYLAGKYDEIDLAGFSLEISIPEQPVYCRLDQLQFRRVLDNLISNAIRHNRLGTILFFDLSTEGGWAVLAVADNGDGIPPERRKRIFEPFVVGSEARSGSGSGLGLSITRRIVEKHGGTIILSPAPRPGRSTEFLLRLPLEGKNADN